MKQDARNLFRYQSQHDRASRHRAACRHTGRPPSCTNVKKSIYLLGLSCKTLAYLDRPVSACWFLLTQLALVCMGAPEQSSSFAKTVTIVGTHQGLVQEILGYLKPLRGGKKAEGGQGNRKQRELTVFFKQGPSQNIFNDIFITLADLKQKHGETCEHCLWVKPILPWPQPSAWQSPYLPGRTSPAPHRAAPGGEPLCATVLHGTASARGGIGFG